MHIGLFLIWKRSIILLIGILCSLSKAQKGEWNCKEYKTDTGLLAADCSNQKKDINVPKNLNENIEVLNLSGNSVRYISNSAFQRYEKKLKILDLSNCFNTLLIIDTEAFAPLKSLLVLDLSDTCFPNRREVPYYRFPASVKTFRYNNCKTSYGINLIDMASLEEFHAYKNPFILFPAFHKNASLKYIDLRGSELTEMKANELAPLCVLKQIRFEIPDREGLQQIEKYCECVKINLWLRDCEVKHEMLNCTSSDNDPATFDIKNFPQLPKCKFGEVDQKSLAERNECLIKQPKPASSLWLITSLGVLLVLAVLAVIAVIALYVLKRPADEGAVEKGESQGTDAEATEAAEGPIKETEMQENRATEEEGDAVEEKPDEEKSQQASEDGA